MAGPTVTLAAYENPGGLLPRDAPRLRDEARRRLSSPVNVRVSLWWVEVLVFRGLERGEAVALGGALGLGRLIRFRVGEPEPPPDTPAMAAYRMLLVENRFWEAHVVGEHVWRLLGLNWARSLAVVPGALARAQEGYPEPGLEMLRRSREWLAVEGLDGLVDWPAARRELWRVYREGWGWLLPAVEPLVGHVERLLAEAPQRAPPGKVEESVLGHEHPVGAEAG